MYAFIRFGITYLFIRFQFWNKFFSLEVKDCKIGNKWKTLLRDAVTKLMLKV